MHSNANSLKIAGYARRMVCRPNRADAVCPLKTGFLLILSVVLMVFPSLSEQAAWAAAQTSPDTAKNLDTRWLPWIGSWRLVSNTVKASDSSMEGMFLLKISPGDNRSSVVMTGTQDGLALFDRKPVAVGSRQSVEEDNCTGWYEYSWSETGRRLLFKSESTCADAQPRAITGMSIFTSGRRWSDIQLLQSGEERVITIRRYLSTDTGWDDVGIRKSVALNSGRIEASANFSINEIIELAGKVAPEVIEAALVELRKPFPLNSKTLERLDDARVPPRIVDLMVAFTFPERFTVEDSTIAPIEKPAPEPAPSFIGYAYPWTNLGFWSPFYPFFPYCYYSSLMYWWNYGSWWNYGGGWNYPYYRPPYYPGGGYGIDRGRLIAGEGYSRVNSRTPGSEPRVARPRSGGYQHGTGSAGPSVTSSGGSSGGNPGVNSGSSGGGAPSGSPSASPGGYSSGGGDRQAKPR
jgi:uncharacterized membrane protein YgcG